MDQPGAPDQPPGGPGQPGQHGEEDLHQAEDGVGRRLREEIDAVITNLFGALTLRRDMLMRQIAENPNDARIEEWIARLREIERSFLELG